MKVAPYYQKLLDLSLQASNNMEPITFSGMFDSATGYLFTISIPYFQVELNPAIKPIFVDLSGLTTKNSIEEELTFALSSEFPNLEKNVDYYCLTKQILSETPKKKILLVLYLGQDGEIDLELLQFLNRLRNLLGWNFSYCIYVSCRLFFNPRYSQPLVDKVLKRNDIPVLPLDTANSSCVLANYEERYGKVLSDKDRKRVIALSGGNSGIIKALYIQAIQNSNWPKIDIQDELLYIRLKEITHDLPADYKEVLVSQKRNQTNMYIYDKLLRYGYLVQKDKKTEIFTPLLSDYLVKFQDLSPKEKDYQKVSIDETLLFFSKSQRKVLEYLEKNAGKIISKDNIAQVLWGDEWADRYSDWAIDQLVSTIREKMTSSHYKGKIITKKGEGIIFLPKKESL